VHSEGETGAAGVALVGVLAASTIMLGILAGLGGAIVERHQLAAAADAAALVAADTVRGLVPGYPCAAAERVAAAASASIASCIFRGDTVTVTVQRTVIGVSLRASARAGPPSGGIR
jgi:secretion/DNA translocation related TadE-like protein